MALRKVDLLLRDGKGWPEWLQIVLDFRTMVWWIEKHDFLWRLLANDVGGTFTVDQSGGYYMVSCYDRHSSYAPSFYLLKGPRSAVDVKVREGGLVLDEPRNTASGVDAPFCGWVLSAFNKHKIRWRT